MIRRKKIYIIVAVLIILTGGIGLAFRHYNKLKNPQDLFIPKKSTKKEEEEEIDINDQFDRNVVNILVVGFDKDEGRGKNENVFRTDTNVLASINLEEKTVKLLSIPRDSYVPIAHMKGKKDKFNSSYVHGYLYGDGDNRDKDGFKYLIDTTRDLLGGIPINYYMAVDMDVVVDVVDAIGGVEMEVPKDVISKGDKSVAIEKGFHKLDGKTLLYYARNRQLRDGDIDRVKNQQRIIMAILKNLKESKKFTALPKIYNSVNENIETNLDFNQLTALALFGKDLDMTRVTTHMLEGTFGSFNKLSYWIIDQEKRVALLKDLFNLDIEPDKQDPLHEQVESINVSISKTEYRPGEQGRISVKGSTNISGYREFSYGEISMYSSNNNIISIGGNGLIRAVGPGSATITVKVDNISRSITVNVSKPIEEKPSKPSQGQGTDEKPSDKPNNGGQDEDKEKPDEGKGEESQGEAENGDKKDQDDKPGEKNKDE